MWSYNYTPELYHHGILGQRWGVRRYQNYDGTYTQRGLVRYRKSEAKYNEAKSKADDAKARYKAGTGSKAEVKTAKSELGAARRKMNNDYKQLKYDKRADQGKALYKQGKTISGNQQMHTYAQAGIFGASFLAKKALSKSGKMICTKYGNIPISTLAPALITAGGTAINVGIIAKNKYEADRLRAYYTH